LAIVEEGAESYPTYSEAARSAKASTEAGTLDRRTLEEHIRDVEGIPEVTAGAYEASELCTRTFTCCYNEEASSFSSWPRANCERIATLPSEIQNCEKYFVLTSPCRRQGTGELCDVRVLGSQIGEMERDFWVPHILPWDVSSRSGRRYTIGHLVQNAIGVKKAVRDETEYGTLAKLLEGAHSDDATAEQQAVIDAMLPVLNVYVYCAPCVCLIHTAIAVCRSLESPCVNVQFRPDSRLAASCCSTVDRSLGMKSISEWVRDWVARATDQRLHIIATHLDAAWLDGRLEHLDYEQPYDFKESDYRRRYIILGEADYTSHIVQTAPGRIPQATDVWHLKPNVQGATRTLSGRFIEHRQAATQTGPAQGSRPGFNNSPSQGTTPVPAAPSSQPLNRRRPASPSTSVSASRRRRYDVGSPSAVESDDEGDSIAQSAAENMQI
jgi:hypothetical protein